MRPKSVIGTQVGDYRILKEIGEEAMGMVYLGEHHLLKQKVAIKALKPDHKAGSRQDGCQHQHRGAR